MRTIRFILQKEFRQIFRNRAMIPIIFVMPFIQLLILANAATFEIRSIPIFVVDQEQNQLSRNIIAAFVRSENFELAGYSTAEADADDALLRNQARMALILPAGLEQRLQSGTDAAIIQILVDAVDGMTAGVAAQYAQTILATMSSGNSPAGPATVTIRRIQTETQYWYNPELNYYFYMIPGILVVLVTMIGGFLSAMNIVREREIGTMEQLNVTPIHRYQFLAGKLLPFWIIAMFELAFGLLLAWGVFGLTSAGNVGLIFVAAAVYMVAVLALGLLISTKSDTQQQAMFITWFIMVLFILMSGLFTPVDSMPVWAQYVAKMNPVTWFIDIMRRVMLTGADFTAILPSLVVLGGFAAALTGLAVSSYRKTI